MAASFRSPSVVRRAPMFPRSGFALALCIAVISAAPAKPSTAVISAERPEPSHEVTELSEVSITATVRTRVLYTCIPNACDIWVNKYNLAGCGPPILNPNGCQTVWNLTACLQNKVECGTKPTKEQQVDQCVLGARVHFDGIFYAAGVAQGYLSAWMPQVNTVSGMAMKGLLKICAAGHG